LERKVVLDVGQAGTGKTRIAREIASRFPRVLIMDPLEEYSGTVFYTMNEVFDYFEARPNLERFTVCLRNSDEADADFLFRLAWTLENVLVVVEEANIYMDPRRKFPSFLRLVSQGRHRLCHLLCVSQRVPEVLIAFRAQKTSLITFFQSEPSDLDHLEDWGFEREAIQNLTPFDKRFQTAVEGEHYLIIGEPLDAIRP
jgi:hypothetical protein